MLTRRLVSVGLDSSPPSSTSGVPAAPRLLRREAEADAQLAQAELVARVRNYLV